MAKIIKENNLDCKIIVNYLIIYPI
jgi:hypothetical protein